MDPLTDHGSATRLIVLIRPGARELWAFNEHRYCSNTFLRLFRESFQVLWPFEFRDCYMRNVQTQQYHISSTFVDRVSDLRSWTVNSDLLEKYPEFSGHIPISNRIPTSLWSFPNKANPLLTFNGACPPDQQSLQHGSAILAAKDRDQIPADGTYIPFTSDSNNSISMLTTLSPKWLPQGAWYDEPPAV